PQLVKSITAELPQRPSATSGSTAPPAPAASRVRRALVARKERRTGLQSACGNGLQTRPCVFVEGGFGVRNEAPLWIGGLVAALTSFGSCLRKGFRITLLFLPALVLDAVQVIDGAQEQRPARDGRRRPAHLVELVFGEHLELRPGPHHERLAVVGQAEDLPVTGPRRRGEAAGAGQALLVDLLAGFGVVAAEETAALLQDVEVAVVQKWRGHRRAGLRQRPGDAVVPRAALGQRALPRGAGLAGDGRFPADPPAHAAGPAGPAPGPAEAARAPDPAGAAAGADEEQVVPGDRRRLRLAAQAAQLPQLFARGR